MDMEISFPGGKKVDAIIGGFTISTDQPETEGGSGTAPEPYTLFLASIGTCAGIFVMSFLKSRNFSTRGLKMGLDFSTNAKTHLVEKITMNIELPPGVPEKYKKAVARAASMCAVKRSMENPPAYEINVLTGEK